MEHRATRAAMRDGEPNASLHAVLIVTSSLWNDGSGETSFRGLPKAGTPDVQLHIGESRHCLARFNNIEIPGLVLRTIPE